MKNRLIDFIIERRRWVLGALLLITLFFGLQYGNLRFENRLTQWIPEEDETLKLLKVTGEKFGANELVLVMARPLRGEAFSPSFLTTVRDLARNLQESRHVFLVTSIANVPYIEKSGDMLEIKDFLDGIPDSPADLEELKEYALHKESYVNNVVSGDGRWLALAVYLRGEDDPIRTFREEVRPLVEERLGRKAEVHYSGIPSDAYFADTIVGSDLGKLVPLIALLVMLVLFYTFRRAAGVVYPLLVVGLASFWVFGFMALFRWKMTLITPAVPVLLIALGSEYGIHLLDRIQAESAGPDGRRGIREAVRQVALPITLAALTTIGGFLSFYSAKLTIIKDFSVQSAWGILFALIIALTLIPAGMASSRKDGRRGAAPSAAGFTALVSLLSRWVLKRHRLILILSLLVLLFFLAWIPRIEREVNFTEYYSPGSPPRQGAGIAQEHFGGAYPLTLYVQSGGALPEEEYRRRLEAEAAGHQTESVLGRLRSWARLPAWRPRFPEVKAPRLPPHPETSAPREARLEHAARHRRHRPSLLGGRPRPGDEFSAQRLLCHSRLGLGRFQLVVFSRGAARDRSARHRGRLRVLGRHQGLFLGHALDEEYPCPARGRPSPGILLALDGIPHA